jgi:hypothetical protein
MFGLYRNEEKEREIDDAAEVRIRNGGFSHHQFDPPPSYHVIYRSNSPPKQCFIEKSFPDYESAKDLFDSQEYSNQAYVLCDYVATIMETSLWATPTQAECEELVRKEAARLRKEAAKTWIRQHIARLNDELRSEVYVICREPKESGGGCTLYPHGTRNSAEAFFKDITGDTYLERLTYLERFLGTKKDLGMAACICTYDVYGIRNGTVVNDVAIYRQFRCQSILENPHARELPTQEECDVLLRRHAKKWRDELLRIVDGHGRDELSPILTAMAAQKHNADSGLEFRMGHGWMPVGCRGHICVGTPEN